jgi:hypothetical protein
MYNPSTYSSVDGGPWTVDAFIKISKSQVNNLQMAFAPLRFMYFVLTFNVIHINLI